MIDAQIGQAELYIRLVNSRDVTSQDALNAQPIQHYMYKYPVLVSGHSRCQGQAKLVKRYMLKIRLPENSWGLRDMLSSTP